MITGAEFKDAILVLAGNVFIVILVVRALGSWAKKEWGELIVTVLAAVLIAAFIYATDLAVNVLKTMARLIFGVAE